MKNLFRTAAIAATFALSTSVSMADDRTGRVGRHNSRLTRKEI